jgi:hypothetical protein
VLGGFATRLETHARALRAAVLQWGELDTGPVRGEKAKCITPDLGFNSSHRDELYSEPHNAIIRPDTLAYSPNPLQIDLRGSGSKPQMSIPKIDGRMPPTGAEDTTVIVFMCCTGLLSRETGAV